MIKPSNSDQVQQVWAELQRLLARYPPLSPMPDAQQQQLADLSDRLESLTLPTEETK
jgi:hypothetical protein